MFFAGMASVYFGVFGFVSVHRGLAPASARSRDIEAYFGFVMSLFMRSA